MRNIYVQLPSTLSSEIAEVLHQSDKVRIERILSGGQSSPDDFWYDQAENEWVLLLEGSGSILFEDGEEVHLQRGDFLNIAAHRKHRVTRTDPQHITLWLAVFYS